MGHQEHRQTAKRRETYLQNCRACKVVNHPTSGYTFIRVNVSCVVELDPNYSSHCKQGKDETSTNYSAHLHIPERSPNDISEAFHRVRPDPRRYPCPNDQENEYNDASDVGPFPSRLERVSP